MYYFRSIIVTSFFTIIILFTGHLFADNMITGIVFNDLNKNGKPDIGEHGIMNVAVSNQLDIVLTDKNGAFSLNLIPGKAVFVIKPAGYALPLNEYNIPQFSFIYNPEGSPAGLNFKGLDKTVKIPDKLYFPLYENEFRESFNVLVSGDPQMDDSTEVDYYRDDIISEMIDKDARFYMALGDIAGDNLGIYEDYNDVVSKLGLPAYNVSGNHDENYKVKDDSNALSTFRGVYGPEYYSFNYGKVHFVVLDDVEYSGWDSTQNNSGSYRGYIQQDQLEWFENDLNLVPDDHLVVLTMHIPILTEYSKSGNMNLVNRDALFRILESGPQILALSGHLHLIENLKPDQNDGWNSPKPLYSMSLGAGCGAWWSGPKDQRGIPVSYCMDGSPNGYFIFNFEGNTFNQHFYPAGLNDDFQIRISFPNKPVKKDSLKFTKIIANVFNADTETEVYCQIDHLDRTQMTRKRMKDPFVVNYFKLNKNSFPYWVTDASATDHIWVVNLPDGLDAGQHIIKISAIDERNNIYSGVRFLEVSE
jgi:3',5'-cyclic AMP phosphodiesterase CpdA